MVPTVEWKDNQVRILDQSLLPGEVCFLDCTDFVCVAEAIRELKVRGAPAIGVTAALGLMAFSDIWITCVRYLPRRGLLR
jgi:methylthioribose-1-phosphate isomerase